MLDQNGMENGEIHTVAAAGDLAQLKSLLDKDPRLVEANGWFGTKPLHYAARSGNLACVKILVERGAGVNTKCIVNKTTPIFEASTAEVARYLVDRGAILNVVSSMGRVPLDYALQSKHVEVVSYLISCGVDVNYQPPGSSYTMLEWAMTDNRNPEKTRNVVEILLKAGADPNQRNRDGGTTILHKHIGIQWLVETLLSYGADPCIRDAWGQSCFDLTNRKDILELLEPYKANLKAFHKQQDDFARLIQRLMQAGIVRREEFMPCSDKEVANLEREHGVKLPREYKKFLQFMGVSAGRFLISDHWYAFLESFDDGYLLGRHFFNWDEADGDPPEWLKWFPKNFFVFASRMGEWNLGFFADGLTDDPEIYRIDDYGNLQKSYDSLWEFIQEMVEYYEYYRDPEGFTQKRIN